MGIEEVIELVIRRSKIKISESKREALIESIVDKLGEEGHLVSDDVINEFEVYGARTPIETREAYGLVITLDANGNAVTVSSEYGFEVSG